MGCASSKKAVTDDEPSQKCLPQILVVPAGNGVHAAPETQKPATVEPPQSKVDPTPEPVEKREETVTFPSTAETVAPAATSSAPTQPQADAPPNEDYEYSAEPTASTNTPVQTSSSEKETQAETQDGEGKAQEAGSTAATDSQTTQAEAIDIDSILQDLDEEDEDQAAEENRFATMINEEEVEITGFLEKGEIDGEGNDPFIFDPELIQGLEEDLRRERVESSASGETSPGGGDDRDIFDPDLLESLEAELQNQNPADWSSSSPKRAGAGAVNSHEVLQALEAFSQTDNSALEGEPSSETRGMQLQERDIVPAGSTQESVPELALENCIVNHRAQDDTGEAEFWDAEENIPRSQESCDNAKAQKESPSKTDDLTAAPSRSEKQASGSTSIGQPQVSHGVGEIPASGQKGDTSEKSLEENLKQGLEVEHPMPDPAPTKQSKTSAKSELLVAKPSAKSLILERLQSYKIAVEATLANSDAPLGSPEDRKAITPGVVARVKSAWESSKENGGEESGVHRRSASTEESSSLRSTSSTECGLLPSQDGDSSKVDDSQRESGTKGEPETAGTPLSAEDEERDGVAKAVAAEDPAKPKQLSEAGKMLFAGFEQRCPPGGEETVVLYVTSVRAVRKTFDECSKLRTILQGLRIMFEERDVTQAEHKAELRELIGGPSAVPQLFIRGHYIGDGESVITMHEDHYLEELLEGIPQQRAGQDIKCGICLGKKTVVCRLCSGNHKVLGSDGVISCSGCNEEGLVSCPNCR